MPFYVYILYSLTSDRYYVGETEDVNTRLDSHLRGISRYTSIANDWKVVYTECFKIRSEAIKREKEIKMDIPEMLTPVTGILTPLLDFGSAKLIA